MNPYTVLLLYPDYLNDNGNETYLAHVEAADPQEAVTAAQQHAATANTDAHGCTLNDPADMAALIVFPGHHTPALTAYDDLSLDLKERPIGTEIYYAGDIANPSGFGKIVRLHQSARFGATYDIELEDGRDMLGIPTILVGDKYLGHGGTRLVTRAAYDAWKTERAGTWQEKVEEWKQSNKIER